MVIINRDTTYDGNIPNTPMPSPQVSLKYKRTITEEMRDKSFLDPCMKLETIHEVQTPQELCNDLSTPSPIFIPLSRMENASPIITQSIKSHGIQSSHKNASSSGKVDKFDSEIGAGVKISKGTIS